MRKCIILLPVAYNDGKKVPGGEITRILREIDEEFDGHTIAGKVDGTYRMEDGHMVKDTSIQVWIAIDPRKEDILKKMAGRFARRLKQETIYFEITTSEVEFIGPE